MSAKKEYITIEDITNLIKDLWLFGIRRLKILLIAGFVGALIGFIYASMSKPNYNGSLSFVLNENEQMPSLNLSSIASIAGIAGIGGSGGVNEDKLLFMSNSRYLFALTMISEKEINGKKNLLANHYIDLYEMQKSFKSDTALSNFTYFTHNKLEELTYAENKVIDKILKRIKVDEDKLKIESKKKTGIVAQNAGIIVFEYTSINEDFTKAFLEELYANVTSYYTNKSVQRQLRNYMLIRHRADSLKEILFSREIQGAGLFDKNTNLAKMTARIEVERSRRDVEILSLMYGEVLKNVEIAKFALENQTPLFQIVDSPTLPLQMKKHSRILSALIGGIVLGVLVFTYLYSKNVLSKRKERLTIGSDEV
jgi:uncharacterized protein involved in exopolysaccharide biosynthesis